MIQRLLTVKSSPRLFQALLGISNAEFTTLLPPFIAAYEQYLAHKRTTQVRQRGPGGGRKGLLTTPEEKLLFILFYVRQYPVQIAQGFFFGMGQPQANYWILCLLPVLEQALGQRQVLPLRKAATIEDVLTRFPELTTFIIDATERPINRPKDATRQKSHYSGKKKRYTVKNTTVTSPNGRRIIFLGETTQGSRHDKALADDDHPPLPPDSRVMGDSGYQGYTVDQVHVTIPLKKPKGGELTPEEKATNKRLAQLRVPVEHANAGIKISNICQITFRNRKAGMADRAMSVSAGLYNFKCRERDLAKEQLELSA